MQLPNLKAQPPQLDHIGIAVYDLADALSLYEKVLGLPVSPVEVLPERGLEVAFVGDGTNRLELLAPLHECSEIGAFLHRRGEGVHHICLRVGDLQATVAALQARGTKLVQGGIRSGAHGSQVAFVHPKEAHGVLIELMELASDALPSAH